MHPSPPLKKKYSFGGYILKAEGGPYYQQGAKFSEGQGGAKFS